MRRVPFEVTDVNLQTLEILAHSAQFTHEKAGWRRLIMRSSDQWPPKAVLSSESCAWTEFWL